MPRVAFPEHLTRKKLENNLKTERERGIEGRRNRGRPREGDREREAERGRPREGREVILEREE
eukprot:1322439-Amorphochlora_amoeboformis.AAC.1